MTYGILPKPKRSKAPLTEDEFFGATFAKWNGSPDSDVLTGRREGEKIMQPPSKRRDRDDS
jgi:hypothetical protein